MHNNPDSSKYLAFFTTFITIFTKHLQCISTHHTTHVRNILHQITYIFAQFYMFLNIVVVIFAA